MQPFFCFQFALLLALFPVALLAQTRIQAGISTGNQDNVQGNIAVYQSFNPGFSAGIETRFSDARYRFMGANRMNGGYSSTFSAVTLTRLCASGGVRVDLLGRAGVRLQGIIDPDNNDIHDVISPTTALHIEPGMLVTVQATDRLQVTGGVSFSLLMEVKPTFLWENNITSLHGGLRYQASNRVQAFVKGESGPAAGGDGDTQKFVWNTEAGLIFSLSNNSPQPTDTEGKSHKIGWFITPEAGLIFHGESVGRTVGVSLGLKLLKDHLKVGIFNYGRSGPLNPATLAVVPADGQTYKGQATLNLRADHGAFGLLVAPAFTLAHTSIEVDVPIMLGNFGAGFYLAGADRITPDGARVSVWENKLFDGQDADFGGFAEVGLRAFFPTGLNGTRIGGGIHYTKTSGFTTFANPAGDFYNNKLRISLCVDFGN